MITPKQILDANSIKDLEAFNYRSIPVMVLEARSINILFIVFNSTTYNYELVNEALPTGTDFTTSIKSQIDEAITNGKILDFGSQPDYEFLDPKFLQQIKDRFLAITPPSPSQLIFKLDTPQEVSQAITDTKRVGGERTYSLNGKTKKGHLIVIAYDHSAGKYRAYTNDGSNGYAPTSFPNAARIPNTVYVVSDLRHTGRNYYVSPITALSFSARY